MQVQIHSQPRRRLSNLLGIALCLAMLINSVGVALAQDATNNTASDTTGNLTQQEGNSGVEDPVLDEVIRASDATLDGTIPETALNASDIPATDQSTELSNHLYLPLVQSSNEGVDVLADIETSEEQDTSVVAAAGTSLISNYSQVDLIASTGNLYWTAEETVPVAINVADLVNVRRAAIYRTSKNGVPGTETMLYRELGRTDGTYKPTFAGFIYHNFGTGFAFYFIAKYSNCVSICPTYIKRITQAGGPATIIAQIPYPASYLQTDGSYLYWADDYAVRRVPIGGGTITKLADKIGYMTMSALDAQYVYYVDAGTVIKRVLKTGGSATNLVITTSYITDFHLHTTPTARIIYWGEENGAVRSRTVGGSTVTYQAGLSVRRVSSIGFDGTRVFWTDCVGYASCRVVKRQSGVTTTLVASAGDQAGKLVWDSTQLFWGSKDGIKKYVH